MRPQASRPASQLRRNLRPLPAPPLSAAVHRQLRGNLAHQEGVSLIELMLVAGVIAAGSAVVLAVYQNVNAASKAKDETSSLGELTQKINDSYTSVGSYSGLTTESALAENLFPAAMTRSNDGEVVSAWGTPVRVLATSVSINGSTRANGGFVVAYDRLPAKACVDLISDAGANFGDIKIQGTSVGVGANLNIGQVGELCNRAQGADVQFIYQPNTTALSESGSLETCADGLPGAPETQSVACPSGQYGVVSQSRSAFCASYYGSYEWTPWTTVSQNCAACPAPETRVSTQNLACPTGQIGTWTQTRDEQRVADCPKPGANGPSETYSWSDWTGTSAWQTTTNTCAPICVLPTPSTENRWTSQSTACPSGQSGHNTWEREETRLATCPAPTGNYTWSGWTATGNTRNASNTCTTCPAPQSQSLTCPAGQVGSIQQNRTFACSGEGSWNAWTTTSNTCTTCPTPQSQSLSCPSGQVGMIQQSRTFNCTGETGSWNNWTTTSNTCVSCPAPQSQTLSCPSGQVGQIQQTRTYNCSGSGSWGSWGTTSNTCTTCPAPQTETQQLACPSFQTGSITQQRSRTYNCSGTGSWGAWSGWSTTSNTCALPACDGTVVGNAKNYMARYPDLAQAFYGTHPGGANWNQDYNQAYAHWYNGGYYEGRQSCWAAPCVLPNPNPETQTRQYNETQTLGCPAGQYGSGINQQRTVYQSSQRTASCPAPTGSYTWSAWSGWNTTSVSGWTTTSSNCAACPGNATEYNYNDYSYRSTGCPAGQTGVQQWYAQQVQTRTRYYNCPAGTTSYPPAQYTGWSGWSDTGYTHSYSSTCTPSCVAPAPGYQYESFTTCPAGRTVQEGYRQRLVSWSCPGPNASYGAWTVIQNPQCCSGKLTYCQIQ